MHERYLLLDSEEYLQASENLRAYGVAFSGDWEAQPRRMDHMTKRPPVYPFLLMLSKGLTGSPTAIVWLQVLLSLFNLWLLFQIGERFAWKQSYEGVIGLCLLLYPAQMIYSQLVMTELVFQTLLLLLTRQVLRAHHLQRARELAWASGIIIVGMFCKPILYLFSIPFLFLGLFWAWRWKQKWVWIWALLPLLSIISYNTWNEQRTGYWHFSSIQNLSLLQYTTYNLLLTVHGPEQALAEADSILFASLERADYGESQRYLQSACFEVIEAHPVAYGIFHVKGMVNFFLDPGRFDLYHFFGWETVGGRGLQIAFSEEGYRGIWKYFQQQSPFILLLLLLIAVGNAIKLFALLVFPFIKRIDIWNRLLVLLIILYMVGLTGVSGASRFAVPLFPLLLLTTVTVWDRWKYRHHPQSNRQ